MAVVQYDHLDGDCGHLRNDRPGERSLTRADPRCGLSMDASIAQPSRKHLYNASVECLRR